MEPSQSPLMQKLSGVPKDLIVGYLESVATLYVMQHEEVSNHILDSQEEITKMRKNGLVEQLEMWGITYTPQELSDYLTDYAKALQRASGIVGQQIGSTTIENTETNNDSTILHMEYLSLGFGRIVEQSLNDLLQL